MERDITGGELEAHLMGGLKTKVDNEKLDSFFFFIGLAVLGNRWHPHVVIRLIHCQLIGLAYFLFCTGS